MNRLFKSNKCAGFVVIFILLIFFNIYSTVSFNWNNNDINADYFNNTNYPKLHEDNLEEWLYFREISLNPSTPKGNYQIKVILNTTNFDYTKTNLDGSDLRFYSTNGTYLDYWIESWNTVGDSIIWVKIIEQGTSHFYMYYGNPYALSMSDGEKTFEFFDDFEGTSLNLSKWNEQKVTRTGTFTVTVEDSLVKVLMSGFNIYMGIGTIIGWHDFYTTGGTYGSKSPNGICLSTDDTITRTEGGTSQSFADVGGPEWIWLLQDIYYLNSTVVQFFENNTLIATHDDTASFPSSETIPIKFMTRCYDYPAGRHYMNSIRSNQNLNKEGTALRMLTRQDWDGNYDDNALRVWVDWVFIHEIHEDDPIPNIGSEISNKIPPIITIISPNNNDVYGTSAPYYQISIFGASINATWYTLDNGVTNIIFTEYSGYIDQTEWNKFGNGTINLKFYSNNTWGNESFAEVLIRKDIIKPVITINSPIQNELYGKISPSFDISVIEPNIDLIWYTLDNGITNISITELTGKIDQAEWKKHGNGTVTIRFYVKDRGGNEQFDEVTVRKETSDPIIIIHKPKENELFSTLAPTYNISVVEPDLDSMWYTLDNGITNITFSLLMDDISQTEWNKKGNGTVIVRFYANDSLGNVGFSEVMIRKDILAPQINIVLPIENTIFGFDAPAYSITVIENNLHSMWYTLDNGLTNIPFSSFTGTVDETEWNKRSGGTVSIRFYANDTLGHLSYEEAIIVKDIIEPLITINSPSENEIFGATAPTFSLSIVEPNLKNLTYSIDNGVTVLEFSGLTGQIDQAEWDKMGNGTVSIRFYAEDEAANIGDSAVTVRKDISLPIIDIISPEMHQMCGIKAPNFELTILEPNIDLMWYTLDYGLTNVTFTSFTGFISKAEWDLKGNESVIIRFYVRDKGGNEVFAEVLVSKDIYIPIVNILVPELGEEIIDYPPIYSISVDEANLIHLWYTLDGGITNTTFTELIGIIDDDTWSIIPDGPTTIRFYAEDKGGNIGYDEVLVVKITTRNRPNQIPGYDTLLLVSIFGISTLILLRNRYKK